MRDWSYIKNGDTLSLREEACTGCGACVEVCPHAVFCLVEGRARIRDARLCMECGACAKNCPAAALTVTAGVGCAAAIIYGTLRGTAPACGCDGVGAKGGASCCG
jgi:ferredoxin